LGAGTLWCVNDYTMAAGLLQTKDSLTDYLKVGTGSGSSAVDGTVTLSAGSVTINPGTNVYGTLGIVGTTGSNDPTFNVGNATLAFKVSMADQMVRDQLILGKSTGTGALRVSNNGGSTTVGIFPQGNVKPKQNWSVILFGSKTGDVKLDAPMGYTRMWDTHDLKINN
jgi:hypothetical protein